MLYEMNLIMFRVPWNKLNDGQRGNFKEPMICRDNVKWFWRSGYAQCSEMVLLKKIMKKHSGNVSRWKYKQTCKNTTLDNLKVRYFCNFCDHWIDGKVFEYFDAMILENHKKREKVITQKWTSSALLVYLMIRKNALD